MASQYERGVAEVFGYAANATSNEALQTRIAYECPFLDSRCVKPSQHRAYDDSIPFGACSVWHRGAGVANRKPHIICPIRFVQDQSIFSDASRLFQHRTDAEIVIVPEVGLPIGRIDYVLAQYDPVSKTILDFLVLEVMACSTTSTGDILHSFHDVLAGRRTENNHQIICILFA